MASVAHYNQQQVAAVMCKVGAWVSYLLSLVSCLLHQ